MNSLNQGLPPYPSPSSGSNAGGLSGAISNIVEKLLFRPVTIIGAETWAERFRAISMEGAALQSMKWTPGQTIQIFLGNLTKRAYTPVHVDATLGKTLFLCYVHGHGPGSRWAGSAEVGDICHVMRPKESIDLRKCSASSLFFGDETSLSTAQALQHFLGCDAGSRFVFEVDSKAEVAAVLEKLGIFGGHVIERKPDGSHLREVASRLAQLSESLVTPQWVLTGNARSIQTVRKALKGSGVSTERTSTRAYWSPGKTGLD